MPLTLSTLALFEFDGEKIKNEPITNQVKCQTAYLSVLMSNNDQVAANQPVSAVPVSC